MSQLKVAFIPTNVSGVVFYRVWQAHEALRTVPGMESVCWWYIPDQYKLHPWENEIILKEKGPSIYGDIDAACEWADVVVWMSLHSPQSLRLFMDMKDKHDKIFLTEIDDYILSIPQNNAAYTHFAPGGIILHVALEQMKASDGLVVSTPFLGELYKPYNPKIYVVENCIDTTLWKTKEKNNGNIKIGWVGGSGHADDLEIIKEVVFETLDENPNVTFDFLHGIPEFFKGHSRIKFDLSFRSIDKYPKWVMRHEFDIGVAPLVDNNFNRGKSNLRWLEYSAMGIPTVASALPHFTQSIRHGETGYIARTKDEWQYNLKKLIDDKALRHSIGLNARREIEDRWSIPHLRETYKSVLEDCTNAKLHEIRPCDAGVGTDRGHIEPAVVNG